jgi:hypothetical protein
MNGGETMKKVLTILLIGVLLLAFAGVAVATELSGEVTAVDVAKGILTVKSEQVEVGFDCEEGSMIKDVKVGDHVTVQYKEEGGKKVATKVTVMPMKQKAAPGY